MNAKANLLWLLSVAMVCSPGSAAWGDDPANPEVDAVIEAIQQSDSAREVSELYASVATGVPEHVGLRDAYMRRLLALESVDLAVSPARTLMRLDRANGVAWSVVAYRHAKDRRLAEAFKGTVCAAALIGEEPNLIENIGQWAALLDNEEIENLDPDAMEQFGVFRQQWEDHDAFVAGYERIQGGYDAFHAAIDDAQGVVDGIGDRLAEAKGQHEDLLSQIEEVKERISDLESDVGVIRTRNPRRNDDDDDDDDDDDNNNGGGVGGGYSGTIEELEALQEARNQLTQLLIEKRQIEGQAQSLQRDRGRAERELEKAQRNKQRVLRMEHAELALAPAGAEAASAGELPEWAELSEEGSDDPYAGGGGDEPVGGAEEEAGMMLNRAKLYLNRDMSDKAKEILEKLIADYPDTQAAATAKELLAGI